VVTDERGKPVADAVVTLTSLGAPAPSTPRVTVVMDQHEKEFDKPGSSRSAAGVVSP